MDTFSIAQRIILYQEGQDNLRFDDEDTMLSLVNQVKLILDEELSNV
jgi:hypothetical protein